MLLTFAMPLPRERSLGGAFKLPLQTQQRYKLRYLHGVAIRQVQSRNMETFKSGASKVSCADAALIFVNSTPQSFTFYTLSLHPLVLASSSLQFAFTIFLLIMREQGHKQSG